MLRKKVSEVKLPPDLESRVLGNLEESSRLENDITARVHIELMLRYIDWVVHLPWNERTVDVLDLVKAHDMLNKNHYGLAPVKDRILEYLAVLKLNKDRLRLESSTSLARRAPILCLV